MIFGVPLRTRATDCGPDRWVTLPAVISYLEHCRWRWMEEPSLGLVDQVHAGHGFYVVDQSIALSRRFGQGVAGEVRCALRDAGRSLAVGVQDLVRDDGVRLAHCVIRGVWVGPGGKLTRLPRHLRDLLIEGDLPAGTAPDEPGTPDSLFDPPSPRRHDALDLALPAERPSAVHAHPVQVRASDLDIFDHVNAANYVRYVADALAVQGHSPSLHRAELRYRGQARSGDALEVLTWELASGRFAADILRGDEVLFRATVETERDGASAG